MSTKRKRNALYGWAPSADGGSKTLSCTDPITGKVVQVPAGSVYNNAGPMKFGLYPTVGKSIGFLNLLSNCCRNGTTKTGFMGITLSNSGCTTE